MTEPTPSFGNQREGASRYLGALREHWVLIVALVVIAVGSAAVYSYTAPKKYKAESDLLVSPQSDSAFDGLPVIRESNGLTSGVLTAARLIQTPQVAERVRTRHAFGMSRDALLGAISVQPLSQSNIIAINATAGSPRRSADIANAFADEFVNQRSDDFNKALATTMARLRARIASLPASQLNTPTASDLRAQLAQLQTLAGGSDPSVSVASPAVQPGSPSWPRPKLSIAIALLVALLLGAGAALALELFNPRISREDELLLGHRLPILARVPRVSGKDASLYLTHRGRLPAHVWEAYRTLRASLTGAGADGGYPRRILVTSAIPGEGKTMTSVNLAITMALTGVKVILIDADLRRPMIATVFGAAARSNGFGLLLLGNASPELALLEAPGTPNLHLLLSNPEHAHLVDMLQRERLETVLEQLREYADVIIIDSPPLTEVGDALPLADVADTVLVAVRLGRSRRDKLDELRRALAQRGVAPAGFVVTSARRNRKPTYGYGYQSVDRRRPGLDELTEPSRVEAGRTK
ncbi:MAG TPA: polysaccharide biosynthesis tyrosine autokinase [Gaiellaceae bacterium]|nr:polysaccharide biosynthesis tyrosine autokinase [Gaiellaceae bacterium]